MDARASSFFELNFVGEGGRGNLPPVGTNYARIGKMLYSAGRIESNFNGIVIDEKYVLGKTGVDISGPHGAGPPTRYFFRSLARLLSSVRAFILIFFLFFFYIRPVT
jgi:hypothetical protein